MARGDRPKLPFRVAHLFPGDAFDRQELSQVQRVLLHLDRGGRRRPVQSHGDHLPAVSAAVMQSGSFPCAVPRGRSWHERYENQPRKMRSEAVKAQLLRNLCEV